MYLFSLKKMEEYQQIKRVTFSGRFPLILSDEDIASARVIVADIAVTRPPTSPYYSTRTYPPNGFLGSFCWIEDDFVVQRYNVDFEQQRFLFLSNGDDQNVPMQVCLAAINASNLKSLATSLGGNLQIGDSPYASALVPIGIFPQLLQFQCYADTALTVTINKLKFEECTGISSPPPPPPRRPKPPDAPKVPPSQPVPPVLFSPNEGREDQYQPYPGDFSEPDPGLELPYGEECSPYYATLRITGDSDIPGGEESVTIQVWGVIETLFVRQDPTNPRIYEAGLICGGVAATTCIQGSRVVFASSINPDFDATIESIVVS